MCTSIRILCSYLSLDVAIGPLAEIPKCVLDSSECGTSSIPVVLFMTRLRSLKFVCRRGAKLPVRG